MASSYHCFSSISFFVTIFVIVIIFYTFFLWQPANCMEENFHMALISFKKTHAT